MTEQEIFSLIVSIVLPLITIGLGYRLGAKLKLREFRNLIVSIDDAVQDNTVTEEEFQKSWSDFKILIGKK